MPNPILLLLILCFPLTFFAQAHRDTLLPLKTVSGSYPFLTRFYTIGASNYTVKEDFPGVPENLDDFRVYEYDFNREQGLYDKILREGRLSKKEADDFGRVDKSRLTKTPHRHSIHLLAGFRNADQTKVLMVDEDNNGSFANDRIFEYPMNETYNIEDAETVMMNYEIFDGERVRPVRKLYKVAPLVNRSDLWTELKISPDDGCFRGAGGFAGGGVGVIRLRNLRGFVNVFPKICSKKAGGPGKGPPAGAAPGCAFPARPGFKI